MAGPTQGVRVTDEQQWWRWLCHSAKQKLLLFYKSNLNFIKREREEGGNRCLLSAGRIAIISDSFRSGSEPKERKFNPFSKGRKLAGQGHLALLVIVHQRSAKVVKEQRHGFRYHIYPTHEGQRSACAGGSIGSGSVEHQCHTPAKLLCSRGYLSCPFWFPEFSPEKWKWYNTIPSIFNHSKSFVRVASSMFKQVDLIGHHRCVWQTSSLLRKWAVVPWLVQGMQMRGQVRLHYSLNILSSL